MTLRKHQSDVAEILDEIVAGGGSPVRNILAHVTPGGGKSTIPIQAAAKLIPAGLADREKVGVKAVSGLLRHKNLRTTEIYLHSIDEGQRLAIDKIQGKFTPKKANVPTTAAHSEDAK